MTSNLVTQVKHTREVIVLKDRAANDAINQCDGCARGAPIRDGMHIGGDGLPFMSCQKDRYTGDEALAIDLAVNEAKKSYGWMRRSLEEKAQQKEDDRYLRELRTRGLL